VCCVSRSNDAYANWQAWSLFFGADNRTCGLAPAKLSGRYVPPGHYDIDFSRLVPERVSHVQVQLLPRIDAQLGVIEATPTIPKSKVEFNLPNIKLVQGSLTDLARVKRTFESV